MNAKEELKKIFDGFGWPSWRMHTMPQKQRYPDAFFTYLSADAPFVAHYNNRPHAVVYSFMIGFYSSDPEKVESVPLELARRLMAAGWTVEGPGDDVKSDEPTHTGRRITAHYIQRI